MKNVLHFSLLALLLCSCATPVQMVSPEIPSLVLKEPQTRHYAIGGTVSVPAGIYTPDFQTDEGIYYRAPGHVLHRTLGMTQIYRGGIFIPNPPTEKELEQAKAYDEEMKKMDGGAQAQRLSLRPPRDFKDEGVWFDQQEQSGGWLIYAATSPKRILRVTEPFNYELQKQQP